VTSGSSSADTVRARRSALSEQVLPALATMSSSPVDDRFHILSIRLL